jgi:uncharacterized membrane protein YbhN (UPF0104 family)
MRATLLRLIRSRRTRRVATAIFVAGAVTVTVLAIRHYAREGWPLADANPGVLVGVGVLFLIAFALKAAGWRRLFARHERPSSHALAAANAAASVTGVALPGRFDDLVRVAVARRFRCSRAGIGALCLTIVVAGFIDSAALVPLASIAAGAADVSPGMQAGLALVAFAGVAAAIVVLALPRLTGSRFCRFRIVTWLGAHSACRMEASRAWMLVTISWSLRAVAVFLLLGALGIGHSFVLAVLFLTASAAAAALPIGPGGAATQAGAGAAALALAGVGTAQAIAFALAAQALLVLAGAAMVLLAGAWEARLRLAARST